MIFGYLSPLGKCPMKKKHGLCRLPRFGMRTSGFGQMASLGFLAPAKDEVPGPKNYGFRKQQLEMLGAWTLWV